MNIQTAADLVRPWCGTDPDRPNLHRPWVQIAVDRFAVAASDGIAAAWVHVLHGKGTDIATHEAQHTLSDGPDILHLSAERVARLPVTLSAVRYGLAIVMAHPHGVCSVLMARRAW
jgi:hypothetical protein